MSLYNRQQRKDFFCKSKKHKHHLLSVNIETIEYYL